MQVEESTLWVPQTERDRKLVHDQMERLLETTHFRNSRRYPALFRFIVEETLEGRGEFLKERLLGLRVFGRPVNYDTAADPIVRVTVAEIRKRIAQYYHEESHHNELRIELLPGCYEPEFRLGWESRQGSSAEASDTRASYPPSQHAVPHTDPLPMSQAQEPSPAAAIAAVGLGTPRRTRLYAAFAGASLLVLFGMALWYWLRPNAIDQFWAPTLSAHRQVTLCLPVAAGKYGLTADASFPNEAPGPLLRPDRLNSPIEPTTYLALESLGENVVFSDVRALVSVVRILTEHGTDVRSRINTTTTLDDLRQGPGVLIGGMDNQWTLRVLSHLRYQFGGGDQEVYWIQDTHAGNRTGWSLDLKSHITAVTRDYAIIARVHDEGTGQVEVVVAGIGMCGTAAAGEMLSDPAQMQELRRRVGADFEKKDFEAVVSTDVVNGIAGSPRILTVETM